MPTSFTVNWRDSRIIVSHYSADFHMDVPEDEAYRIHAALLLCRQMPRNDYQAIKHKLEQIEDWRYNASRAKTMQLVEFAIFLCAAIVVMILCFCLFQP